MNKEEFNEIAQLIINICLLHQPNNLLYYNSIFRLKNKRKVILEFAYNNAGYCEKSTGTFIQTKNEINISKLQIANEFVEVKELERYITDQTMTM